MTPERWQAVKEVFLEAQERDPEEWAAFLAEACAGDIELERQVKNLLHDGEQAEDFFESTVPEGTQPSPEKVWRGRTVGAYRILEEIDEGGMGAVYLAQRADAQYSQKVAVKVIRRGMASDFVVARFRQERQILANLDHPGIARLLDGGTTASGQPYLVMEYIEGEPIDDYCDRHGLSIDERVGLFRKVCGAVHYAHQNLVIHRDIKPRNILVTTTGEPKLLDFGTAKLLEPALAEEGFESTVTGLRLMTPEYASPEQLRAEAITTASDVYSLGVVLYELLTGHRPFHFESRHSPELLRIVCEDEPERPSTVVGRPTAESDGRGALLRWGPPEKLGRRLKGDLDNIVLMAMRKEPQRRYASVEQLSEDLRRHLTGLPVAARRDTWSYLFQKFVHRHRLPVAVGALAVLAVLVAAATALQQARVAIRERARAERHLVEARGQRAKAEQVASFLVDIFEVSNPDEAKGEALTAREVLERGEARIRSELGGQPDVRATLMDAIGVVYRKIGLYERAGPLLEEAGRIRLELVGDKHLDMATHWAQLGLLDLDRGRYEESEELMQRALDLRRELLDEADPAVASSLDDLGRLRYARGDPAGAEALHRESLKLRQEIFGEESREVAESLNNLAAALRAEGRLEESEPLMREALRIRRERLGSRHPDTSNSLNNLAALFYDREDFAAAESLMREILETDRELLGDQHPNVAGHLDNLAAVVFQQGNLEEAGELYREALEMRRRLLGDQHPDIAFSLSSLGVLMHRLERYEEAEDLYREALELRRKLLGEEHPDIAFSLENLAQLMGALERPSEAEPLYRQALAIHRRSLPPGHRWIASLESDLGECLTVLGRYEEAEATLRRAHAALEAELGTEAEDTREGRRRLDEVLKVLVLADARSLGPDL